MKKLHLIQLILVVKSHFEYGTQNYKCFSQCTDTLKGLHVLVVLIILILVSLTKNASIDKYKYFGYGIGIDRKVKISRKWSC